MLLYQFVFWHICMDKSPSDGLQKYRLKRKSPNFSRKKNHLQYKKVYTISLLVSKEEK